MGIDKDLVTLCAIIALFPALLSSAPQISQELGLYKVGDKVVILTGSNFNDTVIQQNRSSLVEFYNSYCGHCKRFAPSYISLAKQLQTWSDVLPICALDCAAEENNDICREYEIMAYPTLRYFGPGYIPSAGNYGHAIETQDLDAIRTTLAQFLLAENRTSSMLTWPNLQDLSEGEANLLLTQSKFIVIVYETENTTLGAETVLRFLRWPQVEVRRVTNLDIASKFKIDGTHYKIAIVNRNGSVTHYSPKFNTVESYAETIETFLRSQYLTEKPIISETNKSTTTFDNLHDYSKYIIVAKRNHVHQADLEMAVHGILFNEISKAVDISGERLLALQRLLKVLKAYSPLGEQGRTFITEILDFTLQFKKELSGKLFNEKISILKSEISPIFTAKQFVGCMPSRPGLRGFTCSLWKLFHFMTVEAARTEISQDPLEVLQAMHGYVKYFFGCTECSSHFQSMATRRSIWNTKTKDDAVLWLWAAHNEVNKRLSNDITEDPEFLKIQFPSHSNCSKCFKLSTNLPANSDVDWDKNEVLSFLKNIYSHENISFDVIEDEGLADSSLSKLRQKRMTTNIFSDVDMHMGMLLYAFCIVMMVLAFKSFAFKGYRKKSHGHDMFWKV